MNDEELRQRFEYSNGVLRNKLNITDADELENQSYQMSAKKGVQILQSGFKVKSISDLNKIHKMMFGELFDWAGENRTYELSKNFKHNGKTYLHGFLPSSLIDTSSVYINNMINSLPKGKCSAHQYAELLDSINDLHPFREGNGRSSKVFLQCLAQEHGQAIDYPRKNSGLILAENNADVNALSKMIDVQDLEPQKEKDLHL